MSSKITGPDLTQRAPRSLRVRLGGYALLPRALDKCRADINGQAGEYHFNCPLDQHFFRYSGIDPDAFKAAVGSGKGDGEMLEWVESNAKNHHGLWEIQQWSDHQERRGPDSDFETLEYFMGAVGKLTRTREDVRTWAELLDLDDYVSFGGKA